MGNEGPHALANEKPVHQVQLSPYCIDAFEVTTRQYKVCSDHGNCRRASTTNEWKGITAKEKAAYDPLCNTRDPEQRARHPVNCVDWQMASEFCASQNGARLPTEAEWEFAARSPDGRTYPWGDDAPLGGHGHLNACGPECVAFEKKAGLLEASATPMYDADDGFVGTAPVGSFPAGQTAYGALDMVGNVWEWTLDSFGEYHATEPGKPEIDPRGPPEEPGRASPRVIRGGAFNSTDASWVRPSFRYMADPSMKGAGIGFRCVLPLSAAH
jgi:formylglycine-generating enzyme required for sulfatase activity